MAITGLIADQMGGENAIFGKRPEVPKSPDYGEYVGKALDSDIFNMPKIEELASKATMLYRDMLNISSPGATDLIDKGTANINSMLSGELPADVQAQISKYGDEASRAGGYGGSLFAGAKTARDLGMTSLDMSQRGLAAAERWLAQAHGRTFDFSRMFLDKGDAIRQAEFNWSRDWLDAQVKAGPDPGARGSFDSEMNLIGMALGAFGGNGGGYTGQYRQNYGMGGGYGNPNADPQYAQGQSFFSAPDYGSSFEGDVNVQMGGGYA